MRLFLSECMHVVCIETNRAGQAGGARTAREHATGDARAGAARTDGRSRGGYRYVGLGGSVVRNVQGATSWLFLDLCVFHSHRSVGGFSLFLLCPQISQSQIIS